MALSSNSGSGGKLIDTWLYEYDSVNDAPGSAPEVTKKKVSVKLRILKKYAGDTPPLAVKSVSFCVVCKAIGLRLEGTDIEALRAAMWEHLDKKYEVKWESFFLVRVSPGVIYEGLGTGINFSRQRVEKGTAWDGTLLLRHSDGLRRSIDVWPGEFRDKRGVVIACIPASRANDAALDEFGLRIDALRKRLADFFRPERIMHTLENLNSAQAALPPPPPPPPPPDEEG